VHGFNDVGQTKVHTAEPSVHEPGPSEVEIAVEKLKRYKSPGTNEILEKLVQAGGNN
jgi:hypothetical protein